MSDRFPSVNEYFHLGKSLKSHGTGGHLRLMIEDRHKTYVKAGSFIFFDISGAKVPYKIRSFEEGAHAVISLEGVDNKKLSDQLSGLDIWVPLVSVKERHQRSPRNLRDKWDEYRIIDSTTGAEYLILRVEEFPQQLMAVIALKGKEALIPLSDELISAIDKKDRIIHMAIPHGLLDL